MTKRERLDARTAYRLLGPFFANGVGVEVNATATKLTFFGWGNTGSVVVEATEDGLVIHEAVDRPKKEIA